MQFSAPRLAVALVLVAILGVALAAASYADSFSVPSGTWKLDVSARRRYDGLRSIRSRSFGYLPTVRPRRRSSCKTGEPSRTRSATTRSSTPTTRAWSRSAGAFAVDAPGSTSSLARAWSRTRRPSEGVDGDGAGADLRRRLPAGRTLQRRRPHARDADPDADRLSHRCSDVRSRRKTGQRRS